MTLDKELSNRLNWSFCHVARLVLQTKTPLSIAQGSRDGLFDHHLVCDANGLAAIPGSSTAGVLRHLWVRYHGNALEKSLFGGPKEDDHASRVQISWGCAHNSYDQPAEGLLYGNNQKQLADPLLSDALAEGLIKRDRVRLDHRGVALDGGQFDRMCLRTGHRFSLELVLWHHQKDEDTWFKLLGLLEKPDFRLGGQTRSGMGAVKLVRLHQRCFNLQKQDDFSAFGRLFASLADTSELVNMNLPLPNSEEVPEASQNLSLDLHLEAEDVVCFGGGDQPVGEATAHPPDLLPLTEDVVHWQHGQGSLRPSLMLITASAVKGALRHRTAFHFLRLAGRYAGKGVDGTTYETETNAAVCALFGTIAHHKSDQGPDVCHPGHLIFDDVYLPTGKKDAVRFNHNSIGRFSGGVRQGALYSEETLLPGDSFTLTIQITDAANQRLCNPLFRQALHLALADLLEGRLALGAGGNRGHGFFRGHLADGPGKEWLLAKEGATHEN